MTNKQNLKPFQSKWNNPTIAVRIPEKFKEQIIQYAQKLDNSLVQVNSDLNNDFEEDNLSSSLVQVKLRDILQKIDRKEKGYKSNASGQLISDLKQLLSDFDNP